MFVHGVGLLGAGVLLVFLSLICVFGNLRDIWSSGGERVRALTYLVVRTVQLHTSFLGRCCRSGSLGVCWPAPGGTRGDGDY